MYTIDSTALRKVVLTEVEVRLGGTGLVASADGSVYGEQLNTPTVGVRVRCENWPPEVIEKLQDAWDAMEAHIAAELAKEHTTPVKRGEEPPDDVGAEDIASSLDQFAD